MENEKGKIPLDENEEEKKMEWKCVECAHAAFLVIIFRLNNQKNKTKKSVITFMKEVKLVEHIEQFRLFCM